MGKRIYQKQGALLSPTPPSPRLFELKPSTHVNSKTLGCLLCKHCHQKQCRNAHELCHNTDDVTHNTINHAATLKVVWRAMCDFRRVGVEAGRARMMTCGEDARTPMVEILALFAGTGRSLQQTCPRCLRLAIGIHAWHWLQAGNSDGVLSLSEGTGSIPEGDDFILLCCIVSPTEVQFPRVMISSFYVVLCLPLKAWVQFPR
jgi:hypothetical protein